MGARQLQQLLAVFLAALLLAAGGCSPGPPASGADTAVSPDAGVDADVPVGAPTVTIATFNVRFLFDTECDSGRCGPNAFEQAPSQAEFDARIQEVAEAIDSLNADIVLLQEVEKQSVLDALNAALTESYPIAELGESGGSASLDVGILARGNLDKTQVYRDLEEPAGGHDRFARQFLRADIDLHGERLIVFTAHFISKRSGNDDWRLAEAKEARKIVDDVAGAHPDDLIVMGGDLNDTAGSAPIDTLTGSGGLVRVAAGQDIMQVFTYVWNQRREDIDHLLLAPTPGGAYVDGTVHSVHDHNPAGLGGSDHGALVARFEMR